MAALIFFSGTMDCGKSEMLSSRRAVLDLDSVIEPEPPPDR